MPKGLGFSLEPSIGNYDQKFIGNWFSNLKFFFFHFNERYSKVLDKPLKKQQNVSTKSN